jgi:hypothetical protein
LFDLNDRNGREAVELAVVIVLLLGQGLLLLGFEGFNAERNLGVACKQTAPKLLLF